MNYKDEEIITLTSSEQPPDVTNNNENLDDQNLNFFCSSREISQIISFFDERELNPKEEKALLSSIKALFLIKERETNIIEAIKFFTNQDIADSLEGLSILFAKNNIQPASLQEIDVLTAKLKGKKIHDCLFINELMNKEDE